MRRISRLSKTHFVIRALASVRTPKCVQVKVGKIICAQTAEIYIARVILHLQVTRPSFFGGIPSYLEALWYPHIYIYRKSNT